MGVNWKDKDSGKVFSIKEVSEITGVPAHTIRFWEKDFGMYLKPVRTRGGQRRYSSEDIEIIRKIKHYRYEEKYTIAGTINEIENSRKSRKSLELEEIVDEIAEMIKEKVIEKVGGYEG